MAGSPILGELSLTMCNIQPIDEAFACDAGEDDFWCEHDRVRELGQGHFGTVHLTRARARRARSRP